ncbi:HGF [Branchiostoma lanceolatum]|uniref:HGF protein n=1 Tax=Branchiostoma lanceolatum TaxID=7740 RepID=A0A8K0A0W0_BRALA|nr:HGF [Branchiostoma lanceolatum]
MNVPGCTFAKTESDTDSGGADSDDDHTYLDLTSPGLDKEGNPAPFPGRDESSTAGNNNGPTDTDVYERPVEVSFGYKARESDTDSVGADSDDDHTYLDLTSPGLDKQGNPAPFPGRDESSTAGDNNGPTYTDVYERPVEVSFGYKARAFARQMWQQGTFSAICRLLLACGVLVITAVIFTTQLDPGQKEKEDCVLEASLIMLGTSTPWMTASQKNSSVIVRSTAPSGRTAAESATNTRLSVNAGTLPTTVTPLYMSSTDINECAEKSCQHGHCVNKDGGYTCICSPGWTGQNCQQDIDECTEWTGQDCQQGECRVGDGASYRGAVSVTETGKTCQRWDRQTPHEHDYAPADKPSSGLEQNYCRNPDGYTGLWCYTTDPRTRWELCDVPVCDVNECTKKPCQHGRCVNKDGGYTCICSPGWTGQNCQQGPGWTEYSNHYYKLMKDKVSWNTAKSKCERLGANLASVKDQGENNFIKDLIVGAPKGRVPYVWLGLHKVGKKWMWTDGSQVTYTNWAPGEPNDSWWQSKFRGENCGGVYSKTGKKWGARLYSERGQWNDNTCSWKYPYVCERPNE